MERNIVAVLVSLALPAPLRAEPEPPDEAPPADLDVEQERIDVVRLVALGAASEQDPFALGPLVSTDAVRPAVLDWQSPVFVWVEPGYVYAETSISFE